jgi:hypothetical protein
MHRNFRFSIENLEEFCIVEDPFAKYQGLIGFSNFVSIISYLGAFWATNEMLNVYDSVLATISGYFRNMFALLTCLQLYL